MADKDPVSTAHTLTFTVDVQNYAAFDATSVVITDNLPVWIAYLDSSLRFRFVNKHYEETFRRSREEFNDCHLVEIFGKEAYRQLKPHLQVALEGKRVDFEHQLVIGDGRQWFA